MGADPDLKILFVEDLPLDMELAERELRKDDLSFTSLRIDTKDAFLEALQEFQPDLIISDYSMPYFDGKQALKLSLGLDPSLPVIILTGATNEDTAVECMKAGAVDYVIKEHITRLPLAVRNALEQKAVRRAKLVSEKELHDSEEHLRLALDAADLGTWRYNLLTGRVHLDERARLHFGFDSDDVSFVDILPRMDPADDAPGMEPIIKTAMDPARNNRLSKEHRLLQPNGTERWLSVEGRLYFEGEGAARRAVLIAGTTQDISDRKRSESLLERYRLLSERTRDIMLFVGLDGRILEANQAAEQAYGYNRSELLALTVTDLRAPSTFANINEQLQQANSSGILFETIHRRKNGSIFPVEVSSLGAAFGNESINLSVVRDITERKRAEETLQESEERYRLIVENATVGIAVHIDNKIVYANSAALQLIGGSDLTALLGRNVIEFVHPDERALIIGLVQASLEQDPSGKSDLPKVIEERLVRLDGSIITVESSAIVINYYGKTGLMVMMNDITERKAAEERRQHAEEDLRKSEERFRILFESSPVGILSVDSHGKVLQSNTAIHKILGYSENELSQMTFSDFTYPEDMEVGLNALREMVEGRCESAHIEKRYIRKNGAVMWASLTVSTVRDQNHKLLYTVSIIEDITERKAAEVALREQVKLQDQLANIAATVPGMIASLRLRPDGSTCMPYASPALQDLYGLQPEDVIEDATPALSLIHPDDMSYVSEAMAESARNLTPFREEWRVRHPQRGEIWVEGHTMPLRETDSSTLWQGFIQDITERKKAEQKLRDREAQYRAVIETCTDGFWVTDRHGHLLEVNDAYVRRSGYTRQELLGLRIKDLDAYQSPKEIGARLELLIRGGTDLFETVQRAKDGSLWQSEISVSYSSIAGGRVFSFLRDISQRKRMEEALRQRLTEAEALYTLSAALRTANSVDEALPVLLDQTLAALNSDTGDIWLFHPASGELRLTAERGPFQQHHNIGILPGHGIAGKVFSSGQVYQSADLASDPLANPPPGVVFPNGQAGICAPIRTAEQTIGVLMVTVPIGQQITPEQVKLINSLTEMVGVALHRIRLHEETIRQMKQLQVVRAIDQAITSSLDLKLTLNFLLEHITSQLKVDAASVLLLQPSTGSLNFAAGHGFMTRAIERSRARLGATKSTSPLYSKLTGGSGGLSAPEGPGTLRFEDCGMDRAALLADEGFVSYHCISLVAKGVQKGMLEIFNRSPLTPDAEWLNFLETLAGQAAIAIDNSQLFENLQLANWNLSNAYDATIEGWSHALDLRDKETEGHTLRVTDLTLKLARQVGVPENELTFVRWGALLHDIGKMGIPDQILLKPGPLDEEEMAMMRKHPRFAFELLTPITYLGRAVDIPYCHHEKWDGTGYPRRLSAEEIPLIARIFSIIDVWDAICSDRPYRPAFTREKALAYIQAEKGTSFDPQVVEAFMDMIKNNRDQD
ncbi:MAG: PAS domain S-box protein [Anaerolineaceae bacterium]|nr:PAS domain S-box protein [Anaerolineaceae bacterium]